MPDNWNGRWPIKADVPGEVQAELAFHLEMRCRQLEAQGLSPEEARREALRRLGDLATVTETCRELGEARERRMQITRYAGEFVQDLRHALRQFGRSSRFTLMAVLTLGLGIGSTTAIFSAVYGILLRPLTYPAPGRLVVPRSEDRLTGNRWNVTFADYLDWREARVFEHVAVYSMATLNTVSDGGPERISTAFVTEEFFPTIGLPAALGRLPTADLFRPGSGRYAVISHGLWHRAFGGEPSTVGKTLAITGVPVEILGVLPPEFDFPAGVDLWIPYKQTPADSPDLAERDNYMFGGIARLAPDRSLEATQVMLGTMAARVEQDNPRERANISVTAEPLLGWLVGPGLARMLWILLGAVGFVLLIGCVNIANLLLGRSVARTRELAVRAALGAGRGRLARQMLTESILLGGLGGALGVALALGGVRLLVAFAPPGLPRLDLVAVNGPALGFALALSLLAALLFGLVPALRFSRPASGGAAFSAEDVRTTTGRRGRRLLQALVAGELALSLLLLIGAGLFTRSFLRLLDSNPGFDPERLLTFEIALQGQRYAEPGRVAQTFPALVEAVRGVPGITEVSGATSLPVGAGGYYLGRSFLPEGRPEPPAGEEVSAYWTVTLPGYFNTIGIPVLQGREFTAADRDSSMPVMVVSRIFARRMFGSEDPIGRRVRSWRDENKYREIVGVVDDVRYNSAGDSLRPLVYVPHAQDSWGLMVLIARTRDEGTGVVPHIRNAVQSVDPTLAVSQVRLMDGVIHDSRAPQRAAAFLMLTFAVIAVVLAAIGIYGVLSYLVAHRSHEIGIRMALGAGRSSVVSMILSEAVVLVVAGTAAGLAGALLLARSVSALLFEIGSFDPLVFVAVPLFLGAVALAASWVPARRASRVDPLTAIRSEV